MSPRAQRLPAAHAAEAFPWQQPALVAGAGADTDAVVADRPAPARASTHGHASPPQTYAPPPAGPQPTDIVGAHETESTEAPAQEIDTAELAERVATIERDAFVKGYAQGERSGEEAAARQGEAMLRRLAGTIDEVAALRTDLMRRTERELVNLALVIAERIIAREVALDRELLVAMARVAIDRLGDRASATIRLNPADHASLAATRGQQPAAGPVQIVADPLVSRGGCLVQSDFGLMDLGIEAQMSEMSRALLGSGETNEDGRPVGSVTHG